MTQPQVSEPTVKPRHDAYEGLLRRCRGIDPVITAVAYPCEQTALAGAIEAAEAKLISPVLIGPRQLICDVARQARLNIDPYPIEDVPDTRTAAAKAVELIRAARAEVLMKGSLHTDELLAAVVPSATGLRTASRISHAFIMSVPTYPKPLIITDAAINIAPTLEEKRDICQNAIDMAHSLGLAQPKVAILSAVETVTTKIPSTIDAAALCKMADRGQITGALLDGPLAMDNAISPEAVKTKGISSPVAGNADILLAPDLEAGNILAKLLTFLAGADAAGIVLGARVPIILTSRADSVRVRMASCAVATLVAHFRRTGKVAAKS
jgi:phosphotransacetylase